MKLNFITRSAEKKSEIKSLRRTSMIPAIIYSRGKDAEKIAVNGTEMSTLMRKVLPGRLSTTIFTLADEKGNERKAIIKDIQYNPTNYTIIHLDFEELIDNLAVNVKVPIECVGAVDCIGVKLGGVLRQVIRHIRVRCLPKDIPSAFQLDVRTMNARDSRRLSDLEIPNAIRPLADLREVAVVIAKR